MIGGEATGCAQAMQRAKRSVPFLGVLKEVDFGEFGQEERRSVDFWPRSGSEAKFPGQTQGDCCLEVDEFLVLSLSFQTIQRRSVPRAARQISRCVELFS